MWTLVWRTGLGLFFIGGLLLLAIELYVLADLHRFEYAPLLQLLGWRGLAFLLLLNAGLVLAVPLALANPFIYYVFITICLYAALATAWNIVGALSSVSRSPSEPSIPSESRGANSAHRFTKNFRSISSIFLKIKASLLSLRS